jgi:hypothetical protein
LKGIGVSTGAGFALSGTASAETFEEWCTDYIQELEDSGLSQSEAYDYFENVYGVSCGSTGIQSVLDSNSVPEPGDLPVNTCVDVAALNRRYCFDTTTLFEDLRRDCGSYDTPPLASYGIDVVSEKLLDYGTGEVTFEFSVWMGLSVDATGDACFWAGEETTGWCFSACREGPIAAPVDFIPPSRDLAEEINRRENLALETAALTALATLIALILWAASCVVTFGATCS